MNFTIDHPSIQKYLQENLEDYLDVHRKMMEINSFTANPQGVNRLGKLTGDWFANLGFQADFVPSTNPEFGNHLILTKSGQGGRTNKVTPSLAMISHLDTVFPPEEEARNDFSWRREGNRIYGPGAVDIKGGTVMIYMVLEAMRNFFSEIYDELSLSILLDASEERLSDDFGALCLERLPKDTLACLVFEGGNIIDEEFQIVVARKGRAGFRVSVEGRSAHSGNNHANGANAIVQISHTIQRIAALTDYRNHLTFNVGTVQGGVVVNRVPHFAKAEVEMRTFSLDVFDEGVTRMLALAETSDISSADGFACKVGIKLVDQTAPWPRNQATDRLYEVWHETAKFLGMRVNQEERGGLSDGNHLWRHFPTLDGLGPAGNNTHCSERDPAQGKDQEFVMVSSFVPKALLNVVSMVNILKRE